MPCWKCGKPLRASDENIGKSARCPYCGEIGEIRRPSAPGLEVAPLPRAAPTAGVPAAPTPSVSEKSEGGQSRGTNVSLPLTGLIGLAACALFYLAVIPLPNNYLRRLFVERSWQPPVMVFLTFWAAAILALKYRKLRVQRSSLLFDVLPTEVADEIHPDNAEAFRSNILSLPVNPENSFLIGRVLRALNHYRVHPTSDEVATLLANQSEIEANIVQSSYSMVKVLVWAIPILGFIGTVQGVGQAVGSFSGAIGQAADFAKVKDSLGGVTTGLSVAFDTTLIALVLSLMIMFPASAIQKAEEDLLASVDQYCNENVLRRLSSSFKAQAAAPSTDVAAAVDRVLARHSGDLEAWARNLQSMNQKLAQDVAEAWTRLRTPLEQTHREQLNAIVDVNKNMVRSVDGFRGQLADTGERVTELARMQEQVSQVHQQLLANAQTLTGDSALRDTLAALDRQLSKAGEVLESVARKLNGDNATRQTLSGMEQQLARTAQMLESLEGKLSLDPDRSGEALMPLVPLDEDTHQAKRRRWWWFASRKNKDATGSV